jgi:hypothetical protein
VGWCGGAVSQDSFWGSSDTIPNLVSLSTSAPPFVCNTSPENTFALPCIYYDRQFPDSSLLHHWLSQDRGIGANIISLSIDTSQRRRGRPAREKCARYYPIPVTLAVCGFSCSAFCHGRRASTGFVPMFSLPWGIRVQLDHHRELLG